MQINVKILGVSQPANVAKGKNKWTEIVVTYEGDKGEQKRKFPSFNKELYELVQELKPNFSYDVELKKEGDYWNWVAIDLDSATKGSPAKDATKSKDSGNTWDLKNQLDRERFEFEKNKQILIIRQSMVAAAVAQHQSVGSTPEEVITTADMFVHYVLNGLQEDQEVAVEEAVKEEPTRRSRKAPEVE